MFSLIYTIAPRPQRATMAREYTKRTLYDVPSLVSRTADSPLQRLIPMHVHCIAHLSFRLVFEENSVVVVDKHPRTDGSNES